MSCRLALVLFATACTSGSERARQATDHREARDSLLTSEVVQALKTPTTAGRLIYEQPAALSYDSLPLKRPDLLRAAERPKH